MTETLTSAIRCILGAMSPDEQRKVLQQLCIEHGLIQLDVPRLYSDKDVAERYGVHVRTARDWIASGRLEGRQINQRWYTRADWLDVFEQQNVDVNKPTVPWISIAPLSRPERIDSTLVAL